MQGRRKKEEGIQFILGAAYIILSSKIIILKHPNVQTSFVHGVKPGYGQNRTRCKEM